MQQFEVLKPFPKPNTLPGMDRALIELITPCFDVLCYLRNPSPDEIADFKKGKLEFYLYCKESIPFFVIDFPAGGWDMDASINILKIKNEDEMNKWLNGEGNIVNLFLIDALTNVLKAARLITVRTEEIRDILEKQTEVYSDSEAVDKMIGQITSFTPTDAMI